MDVPAISSEQTNSIQSQRQSHANFSRITLVVIGILFMTAGFTMACAVHNDVIDMAGYILALSSLAALVICSHVTQHIRANANAPISRPEENKQDAQAVKDLTKDPVHSLTSSSKVKIVVPQPLQTKPTLSKFKENFLDCVVQLDKLQILLDQMRIPSAHVYDGNQLRRNFIAESNNLINPAENLDDEKLLNQWKSLLDAIAHSKEELCALLDALYECRKGSEIEQLKKTAQLHLQNIASFLNEVHYWLAEGFFTCNLPNEAFKMIQQHVDPTIKDPFLFKLANAFVAKKDLENAARIIEEIQVYKIEKEDFFYNLAVDCYLDHHNDLAIQMINKIDNEKRKKNFLDLLEEN